MAPIPAAEEAITMHWRGLIITGSSGAGKSTLTNMLCARDASFEQVRAVTTRLPREDDEPGIYEHLAAMLAAGDSGSQTGGTPADHKDIRPDRVGHEVSDRPPACPKTRMITELA